MFKELVPILRNRAVLMTATALDDDQIPRQCRSPRR